MRTINIIILLFALSTSYGQAQNESKSSKQTRTIEINNDKGDLFISFVNGEISEFIVNDEPISKTDYEDYQDILDDFAGEKVQTPTPPTPPVVNEADQNEQLRTMITNYLVSEDIVNSSRKLKVQLKSEFLKVNGKKQTQETHRDCLDLFAEIYGHELNERSEVKFKKSRKNSSSSVRLVQ